MNHSTHMNEAVVHIPPHVWTLDNIQAGELVREAGTTSLQGLFMIVRKGNGQNHKREMMYQWGLVALQTGDCTVDFFKNAFVVYLNKIKPMVPNSWEALTRDMDKLHKSF